MRLRTLSLTGAHAFVEDDEYVRVTLAGARFAMRSRTWSTALRDELSRSVSQRCGSGAAALPPPRLAAAVAAGPVNARGSSWRYR